MLTHFHNTHTGETVLTDDHMRAAYWHLYDNDRTGLFLEMSLSKTAITLTYLKDMIYDAGYFGKALVIAPDKVARFTWPDEIKKWEHLNGIRYSVVAGDAKQRKAALEAEAEVYIVGVDNLSWLIDLYVNKRVSGKTGEAYGKYRGSLPFDALVIDELSMFKSSSSKRFKKLKLALKHSDINVRIGLTGTPAPNGYHDLFAQILLLDDGERFGYSYEQFEDKYFDVHSNGMVTLSRKPKPGAIDKINKKISDICLTMKTDEYIDLPPLNIVDELLSFDGYDEDVYNFLEEEYVLEGYDDVTATNAADLVGKLLQLTSGAIYGESKEVHELNDLKINRLRAIRERYPDENLVIVYQFRHELARILREFPEAVQFGKGKTAEANFKAWNEGRIKMFVIHPASAGHGLNLQFGGRRMVFMSPTWNLEHWLQTIARLRRRGATLPVFVHRLLVEKTIDMRVAKRVAVKQDNQDFLFSSVKTLRKKYAKRKTRA